jgi:hypothetical protein
VLGEFAPVQRRVRTPQQQPEHAPPVKFIRKGNTSGREPFSVCWIRDKPQQRQYAASSVMLRLLATRLRNPML